MNHLIAKVKGRHDNKFKVASNTTVFNYPDDLANSIEYEHTYKLEDDEWFQIKGFSKKKYFLEFLNRRFISTDYDLIPKDKYNSIHYLCSYQEGVYFFQKLSDSQIVRKKYLSFSKEPVLVEDDPIIIINNVPDAIYNKQEDILYFKKLMVISSIFKGIEILYKEATQKETENFLQKKFMRLENNYNAMAVGKMNRKRIAMAVDTIKNFTDDDLQDILTYVSDYCKNINYDDKNSQFIITSENELKDLLFGIEQRYYTTMCGGEKRVANSIKKI